MKPSFPRSARIVRTTALLAAAVVVLAPAAPATATGAGAPGAPPPGAPQRVATFNKHPRAGQDGVHDHDRPPPA
ncbi:metal-dependent hydrolase, partial [Streptomyces sp. NPDC058625]